MLGKAAVSEARRHSRPRRLDLRSTRAQRARGEAVAARRWGSAREGECSDGRACGVKGRRREGGRSGGTPTRRVEAKRRARARSGSRHSSQGGSSRPGGGDTGSAVRADRWPLRLRERTAGGLGASAWAFLPRRVAPSTITRVAEHARGAAGADRAAVARRAERWE